MVYINPATEDAEPEELPTKLTFWIAKTQYEAEEDMTWQSWVSSNYNTNGFYILDNKIYPTVEAGLSASAVAIYNSYTFVATVLPSDTISTTLNYSYTVSGGSN